jgi:uncharacterized C2H2 Zn-finger protein
MVTPTTRRWIEAAKSVARDPRSPIRCPVADDADLVVEWLPASGDSGRGEIMLRCPACGAVNYLLVPERPAWL